MITVGYGGRSGMKSQIPKSCYEVIALETDNTFSKKRAYYWKGKALYAKKDLEGTLETLQAGQSEAYDDGIEKEYAELIEEITKKL